MSESGQNGATAGQPQTMTIEQAVAAAYQHWNAGQGMQAEHLCRQVLQAWPEHAGALHLLGLLAFTNGNRALAIEYIGRACASPSAPAVFYSNLAEMLRQDGRPTEAETAARRALALDSQLGAAWTNLGIILQETGRLVQSLDCLRRAVAIAPDSPENHNNLGNTLKRLKRLEEAQGEYETALSLRPEYAEAHNNLGFLYCGLGAYADAEREIKRAIEINPHYVDAYVNAAAVALASERPDEALRWLDNLASFAPDHPAGLLARAKALTDSDRQDEALTAARRAVALAPESGEARTCLARVLAQTGACREALSVYDEAAKLPSPKPAEALIGKAELLAELGRNEPAQALLVRAAQTVPVSVPALFHLSALKTYAADDSDIARMEALLLADGARDRDETLLLHFALGKAYLDTGDGARAFAHFDEGCRMKRASFSYDAAATARWMAAGVAAFAPDRMTRLAGAGAASDVPAFVVGMPRSGTTLVEQILAAHPAVFGAGELKAMQAIVDRVKRADATPVGYPQLVDSLSAADCETLGRQYLDAVRVKAPMARRIVDKMPSNFLYAGLIRLILPQARIIHIRRDAMDTCLSCYTKLFAGEQRFSYDQTELGRFYKSYEGVMAHWRALLPAENFLEVRYEDVVADLEGQARRMIAFLGLDWDPACLTYYKNERQILTASFDQVRKPIYRSSVGRWKAYADHLGPLMAALGVAP